MPSVGKRPLTPTTCKTWGPLRLAVPPLPRGEGNCSSRARLRAPRYFHPSPRGEGGPRQAYSSVRQPTEPDERLLPHTQSAVACHAQPRVGRFWDIDQAGWRRASPALRFTTLPTPADIPFMPIFLNRRIAFCASPRLA